MYERFYNFQAKPFRLSPDPRFLYESPGHSRALAYLRYGLQLGEGFIVITGNVGTGKTTLIKSLMKQVADENVVAAHLVTTQLEPDQLLGMVAASFGLANQNIAKAPLLRNLETFMTARAREGKRVLLLVDEAHHLPTEALEELRMLSNYQVGEKAILQSFLVGQPGFQSTLQSPQLEQFRQRVIAAHHLEALDKEETRHYIQHRLGLVGWTDDPRFTDDAYAAISESTRGVPREINLLCDRLLLHGCLEEIHELDAVAVNHIAEERRGEMSVPGGQAEDNVTESETEPESGQPARTMPGDKPNQFSSGRESLAPRPALNNTVSDAERRLIALERTVDALERQMDENYQRLKKLIIMTTLAEKETDLPQILDFIGKVERI